MKIFFLFVAMKFISPFILNGQSKQMYIYDSISHQPIELANVFISKSSYGNFTNKEGCLFFKFSNDIQEEDLIKITHTSYNEKILTFAQLISLDTIFLSPILYSLKEINLINLRDLFSNIFKNYYNLYIDYPVEKECTYKEIFKIDDKLSRIIVSDIDWWTLSAFNTKKELNKLCNIEFKSNHVFKEKKIMNETSGKGYLITKHLIPRLYLNFNLSILLLKSNNIWISSFEQNNNEFKVYFETDTAVYKEDTMIKIWFCGNVIFNKKNIALTYLNLISNFVNDVYDKKTEDSIPYKSETKSNSLTMQFTNLSHKKKFSLSYMNLSTLGNIYIKNNIYKYESTNEIFVTKEYKKKKFTGKSIDLSLPIYKNIPTNISNENSILFNKEEQDFIIKE